MLISKNRQWKTVRRPVGWLIILLLLVLVSTGIYHVYKPLPAGISFDGPGRPARDVRFIADLTYTNDDGQRHMEQGIFDEILGMIARAEHFVLVDMFLFNDFQGALSETHRALSSELVEQLVGQKERYPDMQILVITDPLNTLYGGLPPEQLSRLDAAGIPVTLTNLARLRDSNPLYSSLWRWLVQPWGNAPGSLLPNPFGDGQVSLRSYLALLNFKANHRKLIIADSGNDWNALVTSANPHDGSSAHGNVALRFSGPAAWDLLASEQAVLEFSGGPEVAVERPSSVASEESGLSVRVVTERAVERAVLSLIDEARAGDRIDLAVFYLSDRHVIHALKKAQKRGVSLRVLLDPNKDAFGREKNGIPNRPVAHELTEAGIPLRWCATNGEQCHAKWLMLRKTSGEARMLLGSTNFTRRNLHDLNLETSVVLSGLANTAPMDAATVWFDQRWHNREGRTFSLDYEVYADHSLWHRILYRAMETSGLSTF